MSKVIAQFKHGSKVKVIHDFKVPEFAEVIITYIDGGVLGLTSDEWAIHKKRIISNVFKKGSISEILIVTV